MTSGNALGATTTLLRAGRARNAGHRQSEECEHDGRLCPPARARTMAERRACLKHLVHHPALLKWCDVINGSYRRPRRSAGVLCLRDATEMATQR